MYFKESIADQHKPPPPQNNMETTNRPWISVRQIKHAFAEQRLDYQLIRMLNAYGSMTFTLKAQYLCFSMVSKLL